MNKIQNSMLDCPGHAVISVQLPSYVWDDIILRLLQSRMLVAYAWTKQTYPRWPQKTNDETIHLQNSRIQTIHLQNWPIKSPTRWCEAIEVSVHRASETAAKHKTNPVKHVTDSIRLPIFERAQKQTQITTTTNNHNQDNKLIVIAKGQMPSSPQRDRVKVKIKWNGGLI